MDVKTTIIAEIGLNHNGEPAIARRLIDASLKAGADYAKFQMRSPGLYREGTEEAGTQYLEDMLQRFELPHAAMIELFDYCRKVGIEPLCTPWDIQSLETLIEYGMKRLKFSSADLTNIPLLRMAAKTGIPMIVSTGMSTEEEIIETVEMLCNLGAKFSLLHCQSSYPAPYRSLNMRYLNRLKDIGKCEVGYSGHERGYHIPIMAVSMGASIIEKHITLDRGLFGNDHRVSLLPEEFSQMVCCIRDVEDAFGKENQRRRLGSGERINRAGLAKSLIANRNIKSGQIIESEDVTIKSPGTGLQPNRKSLLIGRKAIRDIAPGDFFHEFDIEEYASTPRNYNFRRPWGLPVRYHDLTQLMSRSNPDFAEFHLSYRDLDSKFFPSEKLTCGFTVHAPDLLSGDMLMDLASENNEIRETSIYYLQKTIDTTRNLKPFFKTETPLIIVSMGGRSVESFMNDDEIVRGYTRIKESLYEIDSSGTELIAQTLPPFPWYHGGQYFLNLFVRPEDTIKFCEETGIRICLDISHTKLACNHLHIDFEDTIKMLAPLTAHLHISDAHGVDGEGDKIGDGEIDFQELCRIFNQEMPGIGFIPEIWLGHTNGGQGFWQALNRLEGMM